MDDDSIALSEAEFSNLCTMLEENDGSITEIGFFDFFDYEDLHRAERLGLALRNNRIVENLSLDLRNLGSIKNVQTVCNFIAGSCSLKVLHVASEFDNDNEFEQNRLWLPEILAAIATNGSIETLKLSGTCPYSFALVNCLNSLGPSLEHLEMSKVYEFPEITVDLFLPNLESLTLCLGYGKIRHITSMLHRVASHGSLPHLKKLVVSVSDDFFTVSSDEVGLLAYTIGQTISSSPNLESFEFSTDIVDWSADDRANKLPVLFSVGEAIRQHRTILFDVTMKLQPCEGVFDANVVSSLVAGTESLHIRVEDIHVAAMVLEAVAGEGLNNPLQTLDIQVGVEKKNQFAQGCSKLGQIIPHIQGLQSLAIHKAGCRDLAQKEKVVYPKDFLLGFEANRSLTSVSIDPFSQPLHTALDFFTSRNYYCPSMKQKSKSEMPQAIEEIQSNSSEHHTMQENVLSVVYETLRARPDWCFSY